MATPIEALQNRSTLLGGKLQNSPTAFAPNTDPTKSDVSINNQLSSVNKQIEDIKSIQLRNRWYGANTDVPAEETGKSDGWLMGGLKAIQRPLNAVVGTAQYALGKGTESSLVGNINKAIETGLTAGNVLTQFGAPRFVQIPLGFALDVALDPINWATAGTAALIPRVGAGLIKGGLKTGTKNLGETALREVAESGLKPLGESIGSRVAEVKNAVSGGWSPTKALETGWEGLKSGVEQKTATAMKLVPFAHNVPGYTDIVAKIGAKAIKNADKYDSLMGTSVYDKLGKGILTGLPSGVVGKTVENLIKKVSGGESIVKFFKYSPADTLAVTKQKDEVEQLYKMKGAAFERSMGKAHFVDIADFEKPGATITISEATDELAKMAVKDADGVYNLEVRNAQGILNPALTGKIKIYDSLENAKVLTGIAEDSENMKRLVDAYKVVDYGKTGVSWYDNFIDKVKATSYNDIFNYVKNGFKSVPATAVEVEKAVIDGAEETVRLWNSFNAVKTNAVKTNAIDVVKSIPKMTPGEWHPFEKILTGLVDWTAVMKATKTGMNVGSAVVNTAGNFLMGPMLGIPTYKAAYLKELMSARNFLNNKLTALELRNMFLSDINSLTEMMEKNSNVFRTFTGVSPSTVIDKMSIEQRIIGELSKGDGFKEVKSFLSKQWEDFDSAMSNASKFEDAVKFEKEATKTQISSVKQAMGKYPTQSETLAKLAKEAPVRESEKTTSFLENEINNAKLDQFRNWIAKIVEDEPGNIIAQGANLVVNKLPRMYEHVDQIQKIASVNYMTKVGLTEQELVTMSRQIPIVKGDFLDPIISGGEKLYRLTPLKAVEASMEAFMNYAAMPGFVQIMKSLPILGSPFFSFQYAMAIKMGKTAIANPAVFNKIGFVLSEISGSRTPAEKLAMQEKYNQYLNSPTVVKIFGMINTNVKNAIPIYGMNIFNPSEKTYDDSAQGRFLKMLDKMPILQDPAGQVIKDFFIQPLILSGTNQAPQGQFGQPVYPTYDDKGKLTKDNLGIKAFYAGRTMLESVVPGSLGYLGLFGGGLPSEVINLIPSYRFRSTALAEQGRSSVGAMTKENAIVKTLRSVLGTTGIPMYTLDTTKISK